MVSKLVKSSELSKISNLREDSKLQERLFGASMCKDPTSIWMQHPITRAAHPIII